jgi:hypothetical protein
MKEDVMTDRTRPDHQGELGNENAQQMGDATASGVEPQNIDSQDDANRPTPDEFARDIGQQTPERVRQQHLDAGNAESDKEVGNILPDLTDDELSRLSILEPGTPLEQGSVYLNLKERQKGPFKAIGGQEVSSDDKIIAKSMTDYEMWNIIAGRDDEPTIERPETA